MFRAMMFSALLRLATGCSFLVQDGDVHVRLRNASTVGFDSVMVGFPKERINYGPLAAGATSSYREVEQAYGYAMVKAAAGDSGYLQMPIDYVGERLLSPGRYTYVLELANGDLRTTLEKEH